MEVTRKLCSCSILANDGCTSAKNVNGTTVTVKSGFFFVLTTFGTDSTFHCKATEVVEQGLESAGIYIQRQRDFTVEPVDGGQ